LKRDDTYFSHQILAFVSEHEAGEVRIGRIYSAASVEDDEAAQVPKNLGGKRKIFCKSVGRLNVGESRTYRNIDAGACLFAGYF
jgi:hypothetical protein